MYNEIKDVFPNSLFYVAFESTGNMCIASEEFEEELDLDLMLLTLTGNSITNYQTEPNLVQFPLFVTPKYFKFKIEYEECNFF